MAKMGVSSRSFLRFGGYAELLGNVMAVAGMSKKNIMDFMHLHEINDRAVFFAENIQTLTDAEIREHLSNLRGRLIEIGADGVIEFHPTADGTSKSAHIHYWGKFDERVEEVIEGYIKENRLSNKTNLNYTDPRMKTGKTHRIVKGELVEFQFEEEDGKITRETIEIEPIAEEEIALKNKVKRSSFLDEIIEYCDAIMEELDAEIPDENRDRVEEAKAELDLNELHAYIYEMEMELE